MDLGIPTRISIHGVCHDESPWGPACRHVVSMWYQDGSKHRQNMSGREIAELVKDRKDVMFG